LQVAEDADPQVAGDVRGEPPALPDPHPGGDRGEPDRDQERHRRGDQLGWDAGERGAGLLPVAAATTWISALVSRMS